MELKAGCSAAERSRAKVSVHGCFLGSLRQRPPDEQAVPVATTATGSCKGFKTTGLLQVCGCFGCGCKNAARAPDITA